MSLLLARAAARHRNIGPSDPFWASVGALLHFDGVNGATSFPDAKGATTWAKSGTVVIDTSASKFGGASGKFSAASYLDSASALLIGAGDFTAEGFARWSGDSSNLGFVFDWRPIGTNGSYPTLYVKAGGVLVYYANGNDQITASASLSTTVFKHVAVCRASGFTRLFVDGVQSGSTFADALNYQSARLRLGGSGQNGPGSAALGWLDDFRFTLAARYTANFTPPTASFPNHG